MSEENCDAGKCYGIDVFAKGQRDITTICEKFLKHLENFVSFALFEGLKLLMHLML